MRYSYPAIFTKEEKGYSVIFPDLEGCYTCGDDMNDALYMASDVLAFTLFDYEKTGKPIPAPSDYGDIEISENEFINFVSCDTIEYQRKNNNKAVKKTLSIPEWLNAAAQAKDINFSQVLQDALKEKLGY
ncbi:MAG: type II toxin-antitoxin system HicB family antitoxin [Clostridiales bacterium]|nr:type II toxin-antitoxin system HicB family antitoxin [Clostridiales bacterium]